MQMRGFFKVRLYVLGILSSGGCVRVGCTDVGLYSSESWVGLGEILKLMVLKHFHL